MAEDAPAAPLSGAYFDLSGHDLPSIFEHIQARAVTHITPCKTLKINSQTGQPNKKENITFNACGRMHTISDNIQKLFNDQKWQKKLRFTIEGGPETTPVCNCQTPTCTKLGHPMAFAMMSFYPLMHTVEDLQRQKKILQQKAEWDAAEIMRLKATIAGNQLAAGPPRLGYGVLQTPGPGAPPFPPTPQVNVSDHHHFGQMTRHPPASVLRGPAASVQLRPSAAPLRQSLSAPRPSPPPVPAFHSSDGEGQPAPPRTTPSSGARAMQQVHVEEICDDDEDDDELPAPRRTAAGVSPLEDAEEYMDAQEHLDAEDNEHPGDLQPPQRHRAAPSGPGGATRSSVPPSTPVPNSSTFPAGGSTWAARAPSTAAARRDGAAARASGLAAAGDSGAPVSSSVSAAAAAAAAAAAGPDAGSVRGAAAAAAGHAAGASRPASHAPPAATAASADRGARASGAAAAAAGASTSAEGAAPSSRMPEAGTEEYDDVMAAYMTRDRTAQADASSSSGSQSAKRKVTSDMVARQNKRLGFRVPAVPGEEGLSSGNQAHYRSSHFPELLEVFDEAQYLQFQEQELELFEKMRNVQSARSETAPPQLTPVVLLNNEHEGASSAGVVASRSPVARLSFGGSVDEAE